MADSFIQVAPDGTGKLMQTYLNTISANAVHAEAVCLVDSSGNPITTLNVNVGSSINANFTGTVNVAQSGTWNIGTVASITNAVTVAQSNASNLLTTASQGGTWNIGTLTSITNPITVQQTNASNLLVTATQGGTWNIGTITTVPNIHIVSSQGGAFMANGQVAATNVAATLVAARATRRSVTIRNLDGANSGYIGLPVITASNGMLFLPQDSISVDYVGLIQVIMSSGTANFAYLETYD